MRTARKYHTPTSVEPSSDFMGRVLELIVFASPLVPPGTRDPAITSEGVLVFSSNEDEAAYKSVLRVKCPRGAHTVSGKRCCHELGGLVTDSGRHEFLPPATSYSTWVCRSDVRDRGHKS